MAQDIMNEGPGLKQRARETKAVLNTVDPEITKAPPANPPQQVDKIHPKAKFGSVKGEVRLPVDQWTRPLSSYKDGTDYVPKTGPAILHEGEKVTPAKDNLMSSLFDKVPGRKADEKPPKKLKSIHTRKAKGGYIHEHHHTDPSSHPMEEHTSADKAAMLKHMDDHMGQPDNAAEEATESTAGGAPAVPGM
jgi:hypothetical protein